MMESLSEKLELYKELADFIAEKKLAHGAKIGAGQCECMAICLEKNPQLRFLGMDTWEDGQAEMEAVCRIKCAPYKERVTLLKGDAATIAKGFASKIFDFAFYCFNEESTISKEDHIKVLKMWKHKIKPGGYLIGDCLNTTTVKTALAQLGYEKIAPLEVLGHYSKGLQYIQLN